MHCGVTVSERLRWMDLVHRVGHRLGFRLVTDSASSLSIGTGLAGTTTLPLFTLPRFWSCYCSPGRFCPKVRPFALKGTWNEPILPDTRGSQLPAQSGEGKCTATLADVKPSCSFLAMRLTSAS